MKFCKKCQHEKDDSEFYASSRTRCKECVKSDVKKNLMKVGSAYDFSEKGVIRVMYKTQKRHNKLRGHGEMIYTKEQFSSWLYSNGFKKLFDEWVCSGHSNELKPSADRINDFKGYSFDNLMLVTWKDNMIHHAENITNVVGTGGLRCKKVGKFNHSGSLICEYVSYWSAVRDIGYAIEYQIKKGVKCRNGFYWKYI